MRHLVSLCLTLAVAGCTTVGVTTPSAPPAAPANPTGLDYLRDDIANLVIAIDLPQTVQFVATQSHLDFDVNATDASAARHVKARLAKADGDGIASSLPALAAGHLYYLYQIADADKAAIREAQSDAQTHAVPPASVALSLAPSFCSPHLTDATQVVTSVRLSLSGKHVPGPLIDRQTLAQLLARSGASTMIAICDR